MCRAESDARRSDNWKRVNDKDGERASDGTVGIFYELFACYANTQWMLVCLRLEQASCKCWLSASEIM